MEGGFSRICRPQRHLTGPVLPGLAQFIRALLHWNLGPGVRFYSFDPYPFGRHREKWVKCRGELEEAGRTQDAGLFNLFWPDVRLDLQHEYRCVALQGVGHQGLGSLYHYRRSSL